jgi:hypothetical protein
MKKFLTGLAAAGLMFGALSASNALTQFAVLNPVPGGPQTPYFFDNASMTFNVIDQDPITPGNQLNVRFQFLVPVPVIGTNDVPAILTINGIGNTPMVGTSQPLEMFEFTVTAANPGDVFGSGVLLRTIAPDPILFPAGTLADLFSVGSTGFLGSEFAIGLMMESDYLNIDPDENQTATWSYSLIVPSGPFAPGANGKLRDTQLGGNANFAATFTVFVPEPGSVAMLIGFGVGGSLMLMRRRRAR